MCGILAIFNSISSPLVLRQQAMRLSKKLRHRGPDASGIEIIERNGKCHALCHERLSIVDTSSEGHQPMTSLTNPDYMWIHNGETYNYPELRKQFEGKYKFHGDCDSQIIGILYEEYGMKMFNYLEGMWAFVIYDRRTDTFLAARDHVGIIPTYIGTGKNGERYISNELKSISDDCVSVEILKPGHYITEDWVQREWYQPEWYDLDLVPTKPADLNELKENLTQAILEQLMGDVPFGLLISGGVDSSLIASVTMKLVKEGKIDLKKKGMTEVHSFCIGLKESPDLKQSRIVADFIGTVHHELVYTVEEGIDHIPHAIYHMETFNPTTIRAGTPMMLMARKIKALGIKMVLTGEGADEIFGGYLYFHKAPNEVEFHKETIRKVRDLYKYDLLRANKSALAYGLEVRPPFLHKKFIEYAMSLNPKSKHPKYNETKIEKYILRKAFDNDKEPYLPIEILWRQKEQFSDGVGYGWIDGIKKYAEIMVTEEDYKLREELYPVNTPTTKEMFLFRRFFQEYFRTEDCVKTVPFNKSIACSTQSALEWDESFKKLADESGRAILGIHQNSYEIPNGQSM